MNAATIINCVQQTMDTFVLDEVRLKMDLGTVPIKKLVTLTVIARTSALGSEELYVAKEVAIQLFNA